MSRKAKPKKVVKTAKPKKNQQTSIWRQTTLEVELTAIGLRIEQMSPDGNCFFRAVADQLHGDASQHVDIRRQVVQHMRDNEASYAPFVEFDEAFEKYADRMARDGTWAGNIEVQATSMCFQCNVHIYQQGQACWRTVNFTPPEDHPCLHLSYHDGDHYNSVRLQSDAGGGPPEHIDLAACQVDPELSPEEAGVAVYGEKDVAQVSENTLCFDKGRVHAALQACAGDVDAAVEWLIEALGNDAEAGLDPEPGATAEPGAAKCVDADAAAAGSTPRARHTLAVEKASNADGAVANAGRTRREPAASSAVTVTKGGADCRGRAETLCDSEARSDAPQPPSGEAAAALERQCPSRPAVCSSDAVGTSDLVSHACALDSPSDGVSMDGEQAADTMHTGGPDVSQVAQGTVALRKPAKIVADSAAGQDSKVVGKAARRRAAAEKRPAKNKLCPCGSGRKYKNCCKVGDERRLRVAASVDGAGSNRGAETHAAARLAALHLQVLDI